MRFTDEAIRAAVYQSNRYITDRFLPDKAIDVLDEAGARVKLGKTTSYAEIKRIERELRRAVDGMKSALARKDFDEAVAYHDEEVTLRRRHEELKQQLRERVQQDPRRRPQSDVEEVISRWTGIPIQSVAEEEADKLIHMEDYLHERIVGQEEAISALSRAIRRSRAGLKNPNRPIGSFVFLGPTGVGKTEVARTLAEFLFDSERALVRFDMSEYMEKHAIAKMIGSPPGYVGHEEGGQLTEQIKRKPYSVILLDEIEKAHPDVLNILLQVLEDGMITDAYGQAVDFKNTIVIMTSNIGSQHVARTGGKLGFKSDDREQEFKDRRDLVMAEVKRTLSPEFINRIDEIIVFDALTEEQLRADRADHDPAAQRGPGGAEDPARRHRRGLRVAGRHDLPGPLVRGPAVAPGDPAPHRGCAVRGADPGALPGSRRDRGLPRGRPARLPRARWRPPRPDACELAAALGSDPTVEWVAPEGRSSRPGGRYGHQAVRLDVRWMARDAMPDPTSGERSRPD